MNNDIMGNDEERFSSAYSTDPRMRQWGKDNDKDFRKHQFDNSYTAENNAEKIAHFGFDSSLDLDKYIREQEKELDMRTRQNDELNEELKDANKYIEESKKYGLGEKYDSSILNAKAFVEEKTAKMKENEKIIDEIQKKLKYLKEVGKNWQQTNKDSFFRIYKDKNSLLEQLKSAEEELKRYKIKEYNGTITQLELDRMNELENDIIPRLNNDLKHFHDNLGYKINRTCKVTFDTKGGNVIPPVEIEEGSLLMMPPNPVLDDEHEFDMWTVDGVPFDPSVPITKNITLEAKYKEIEFVTVSFDTKGGTEIPPLRVKKGEPLPRIENPELDEFHEFDRWSLGDEDFDITSPITEDITLSANYKKKRTKIEDKKHDIKKVAKTILSVLAGVGVGALTGGLGNGIGALITVGVGAIGQGALGYARHKLTKLEEAGIIEEFDTPSPTLKQRVKGFFKNKENLKNLQWFFGSTMVSSAGFGLYSHLNSLGNSTVPPVIDDPKPPVIDDPKPSVPDLTNDPDINPYENIKIGNTIDDNVPKRGYDTAQWAKDGIHSESLIPEYVNENTIFKRFAVVNGNGQVTEIFDKPGMGLKEILDQGYDIEDIVADLGNDGISVSWNKITELISFGGKTK